MNKQYQHLKHTENSGDSEHHDENSRDNGENAGDSENHAANSGGNGKNSGDSENHIENINCCFIIYYPNSKFGHRKIKNILLSLVLK